MKLTGFFVFAIFSFVLQELFRTSIALACALLLFTVSAFAAPTATLSGRVTDASGAVVPNVEVTATNTETNAETTVKTNRDGLYVFAELAPGNYRLTARSSGFQTTIKEDVILNVESRVREDFALAVGSVAESVSVESNASFIEQESGEVGTTIDRTFIENLPLNGRSFQTLIELAPGVVTARSTIQNPGQFSVNGQRTNANYFLVDGVSGNIGASFTAQNYQQAAGVLPGLNVLGATSSLVSVDALQEFRVQTSSYAPEFGRSPGAQISLASRSGTNDLTFSLFNYFRNEKLDANEFFLNARNRKRLPLRQNNFGGTIGAPVFLPRFGEGTPAMYNGRDKTFFFFSYEGLRLRQPQITENSFRVPTLEARQAATGALRELLDGFPLPNAPRLTGDAANVGRYVVNYSFPTRSDATSVRVDHIINERLNLFGRYNDAPSSFSQRAFANGQNAYALDTRTLTVGATYSIASNIVNDFRANYSTSKGRFNFEALEIDGARLPSDALLFPSYATRETTSTTVTLFPGGTPTSISQGRTLGNQQRQLNLINSLTFIKGNHQLKFGGDYRRLMPILDARSFGITYNLGDNSNLSIPAAQRSFRTDGRVDVSVQALAPLADFRFDNFSLFAQDTWRATPRLSLTYGVRYDVNPPLKGERLPATIEGLDNPLTARLAPENTAQFETDYLNFAPRLGLAYRLTERGDLVVRAGGGIFYDVGNATLLRGYSGFPFNSNITYRNVEIANARNIAQPASFDRTTTPYSSNFYVFDPKLKLPRTYQYNFSVEKGFGANQTVTASYVGAHGRELLVQEQLRNLERFGPAANPLIPERITVINPDLFGYVFGTNPRASSIYITRNQARSNYQALQTQYQRRLSRGLQALTSYTYAVSQDDASDDVNSYAPTTQVGNLRLNRNQDYSFSDFDVRHNFIAAVTYELPRFRVNALTGAFINGWAFDTITRARSAFTLRSETFAVDPVVYITARRPDVVPNVPIYLDDSTAPGGRRINPDAFTLPRQGEQGNLARNTLRGFPFYQFDLTVRRNFGLTEKLRLQLRADAFNLFNRANFGDPVVTLGSPQFGVPLSTLNRTLSSGTSSGFNPLYQIGGPRSIQLSLKLIY